MQKMRDFKITSESDNRCTITYVDVHTDEAERRTFWAPSRGGYVHEISRGQGGTLSPQVCEELGSAGNTLSWRPGLKLADIIRREFRAMRRWEAREAKRWA